MKEYTVTTDKELLELFNNERDIKALLEYEKRQKEKLSKTDLSFLDKLL